MAKIFLLCLDNRVVDLDLCKQRRFRFISGGFQGKCDESRKTHSRIKVHFVPPFLENFMIIFVSVFKNVDYIQLQNLSKNFGNDFQI